MCFMKMKSRYLEAIGVDLFLNREFVLDTTVQNDSRDDPLSYQATRLSLPDLLSAYRFDGLREFTV